MNVPLKADGPILDRARSLPPSDLQALAGEGDVLVISPHPGDETLGCGAAIMAALAEGRRVTVALVTDGRLSHPSSRTHPPRAMASLQRREFDEALARLAAEAGGASIETMFLGLPHQSVPHKDGALAPVADGLAGAPGTATVGAIWCSWRGDGDADHVAAARLADLVEERLRARGGRPIRRDYAIWGRFCNTLPDDDILTFPLGGWQRAKAHAMVAYTSQITQMVRDVPSGFVVPPALTAHFASAPEIFLSPPRRN